MLFRACRFPLLAAASKSAEEPFSWASYKAAKSPVLMLMPPAVRLPSPYCPSRPVETLTAQAQLETTKAGCHWAPRTKAKDSCGISVSAKRLAHIQVDIQQQTGTAKGPCYMVDMRYWTSICNKPAQCNTCKLGLVQELMGAMLGGELGGAGTSHMAQVATAATVAQLILTQVLPCQAVATCTLSQIACMNRKVLTPTAKVLDSQAKHSTWC